MALNTMIQLATIILSLLVAMTYQYEQGAKPGPLYKLCGNDFVQAWQNCCDYGYPNCANVPVVDAVEALERRGNPLMPSRVAKNFLGALRKRGWGSGGNGFGTAAAEECCTETCSYKEVSEYPCHTR